MSSDPASLPVPPTVMVPAGTNYLLYLATSSPGSSGKNVTISATYGGATASVMVPIN